MNLENLTNKLNNVLNFIEKNNNDHYDLNERLLRKEALKGDAVGSVEVPSPEGTLAILERLIERLNYQSEFQRVNLDRTVNLLEEDKPEVCVGITHSIIDGIKIY